MRVDDSDLAAVRVDEEGDGWVAYYLTIRSCFNHASFAYKFSDEWFKLIVVGGNAVL